MPDDHVAITVRLPASQLREINRRAGLGPFDGRARSEYIVGRALGESRAALLERVREVQAAERARFRAELQAERARAARSLRIDSYHATYARSR